MCNVYVHCILISLILLVAANDKVYHLLAHGWWFSPGTPDSSTTKTGSHDIAEILLKVALKRQKSNPATSRVHPFCNLQSRVRTHAVLEIGL
jgi:hypothetical protein